MPPEPERRGPADRTARLGLNDRVLLTLSDHQQPWPEEQLSQLYAGCEIGVSSTTAEAWGLVAFEHAQHGAAQILPRHAGLAEIWGDAPAWISLGGQTRVDMTFAGAEPQVDALTITMLNLIERPDILRSVALACQRRAHDRSLSWEAVAPQWVTLVSNLLDTAATSGSPVGD